MSGDVDFDEFVEYVFSNAAMDKLFRLESSADEEECKTILLGKSQAIRAEASKAVKESGENWRNLTWRQRCKVHGILMCPFHEGQANCQKYEPHMETCEGAQHHKKFWRVVAHTSTN